ncbi:MAG: disulfide bond formation protein B [Candidatus Levybacteria bacterium]|nr:disulfide bond formation protein B [Candidatus Levybacteria bacterium]MBP9815001.1 disulfide bond formation protein B [Candidatus Levybacteria bacterium]
MDTSFAPIISFFALGTLALNIGIFLGIVVLLVENLSNKKSIFTHASEFVHKNSLLLAFLIATMATLSSLFLSEIVLFPPCKLCWYQRIFMYPQVIILGVGLLLNDKMAKLYALILSVIGLMIAAYHILLQFFPGIFPCTDEIASCALKQFDYFGYITIPVMSASAFAAIIVILVFGYQKHRKISS